MSSLQMSLIELKRRTSIFIAVGCGLVALIGLAVAFNLSGSRDDATQQAQQRLRNSLLGLESNIVRTIDSLDRSLQATRNGLANPGLDALDPTLRQAILFDGNVGTAADTGLFVFNERGDAIYGSQQPVPKMNVADRPYFRAAATSRDLGLFVGDPIQMRMTGNWVIVFARRFNHPDGTFAGVVTGAIELKYFEDLFRKLNGTPGETFKLYATSGEAIARWPRVPNRPMSEPNLDIALKLDRSSPTGFIIAVSPVDNVERIFAYSRFENYPFILTVGIPSSDVFLEWYRRSVPLGGIVIALVLGGAFVSLSALHELRRRILAELRSTNAELIAKSASARMETLFAASQDSMLIARVTYNGDFVYEDVNPVWENLTGVSAATAIGRRPQDVLPQHLAEYFVSHWQESVATGKCLRYAFKSPKDGDQRSWEALVVPVGPSNGKQRRLIAVSRDVTERDRVEAASRQAMRLESVGQLTAGLAHNFNNLLQAIYGAVEMLNEQTGLDEEGRECVQVASQAARRGSVLVHRLLAFARKQPLVSEVVAVEQLMTDMTLLLQHTLSGRIHVETHVDRGLGYLQVDATQLESCLLNMALNARDAMPRGGTLRMHVTRADAVAAQAAGLTATDYIRFVVEDTGQGMTPETRARVFEPFYTTKAIGEGTGLGMSMVHGFAKQSGGDVQVDYSSPEGTGISLWLPSAAYTDVTEVLNAEGALAERWPKRIMIVDDEEIVCRMLVKSLGRAGYETLAALSAEDALEMLNAGEHCDLLVTDQSMPGLSGTELIMEAVRLRPSLLTILISGYNVVSGMDQVPGNVVLLHKPFEQSELLGHVRVLIGPPNQPPEPESSDTSIVVALRPIH